MDLMLEGKKVLVTGASKGLGAAIVKAFIKEGANVAMCSRSYEAMSSVISSLDHAGDRLTLITVDAVKEESIKCCVQKAAEKMDGLDILVNNVGGANRFAAFFELDNKDWTEHFQLNVMSMVHFTKQAHPYLKASNSPRVVNISSVVGLEPGFLNPHYSVCKAAAINLSKHMSKIFASDKILVNCIAPGPFESDSWVRHVQQMSDDPDMDFDKVLKNEICTAAKSIPLGRIGVPDDITPVVLLLSSPVTCWTTGSCFVIDGGKMKSV